ncbi:hypothetical protein ACQV4C_24200 [Streptomyces albidoflavus]|uniref:hypothetical protein n=1 Tax=Streptomyces albidoflavus TaxID=1886 RepID=UPI0011875065|nr:hypothetical protein [Streptomyces albidoflavus]MBL0799569.1 hypothetical protein [Streptomyces albidoflavus]
MTITYWGPMDVTMSCRRCRLPLTASLPSDPVTVKIDNAIRIGIALLVVFLIVATLVFQE